MGFLVGWTALVVAMGAFRTGVTAVFFCAVMGTFLVPMGWGAMVLNVDGVR